MKLARRWASLLVVGRTQVLWLSVSILLGFWSYSAPATTLTEAIQQLADGVPIKEQTPASTSERLAIWPFESKYREAAIICRGLLASRLQERLPAWQIDLHSPELLSRYRTTPTFEAIWLQQVGLRLQTDHLMSGRLTIWGETGVLLITLWDTQTGMTLYAAETSFEIPSTWRVSTTPPSGDYRQIWKSRVFLRQRFLATAIGDFDGDAENEVALVTDTTLHLLKWHGMGLELAVSSQEYGADLRDVGREMAPIRLLQVESEPESDRLLISIPPESVIDTSKWEMEQKGMAVAVADDTIWYARFQPHQGVFSGAQTVRVESGQSIVTPMPFDYVALTTGDIDEVAGLEYVLMSPAGNLAIYRRREGAWELWWQSPSIFGASLAAGDLDGDRFAEVVCSGDQTGETDSFAILESDEGLMVRRGKWKVTGQIVSMAIGDVDGNDVQELLVLVHQPLGSVLYLYGLR